MSLISLRSLKSILTVPSPLSEVTTKLYPISAVDVAGKIMFPKRILFGAGPPGSACILTPLIVALLSVAVLITPPVASAFKAIALLMVVLKFASSPKAALNSFNVLSAPGAAPIKSFKPT